MDQGLFEVAMNHGLWAIDHGLRKQSCHIQFIFCKLFF
jgi:hypothetical protein